MIEACLFDFDGTLTELTLDFSDLRGEVEKIALKYVADSLVRGLGDLYIVEMIYAIENHLGSLGKLFREEAFIRLRDLEVEGAQGKAVYPYVRKVLRALRKKGILIGIMTRNCRAAIGRVFPDMLAYVDAVATREDVAVVKPDPGHVMAILDLLGGIDPSKAFLVGDHPTDISAGKRAGLLTVGVLTGRTERPALEQAGASFIASDIREVPDLVDTYCDRMKDRPPV